MAQTATNSLDWSRDREGFNSQGDGRAGRVEVSPSQDDGDSAHTTKPVAERVQPDECERGNDRQVLRSAEDQTRLAESEVQEVIKPEPGIYPGMSADDYHAVRAVSSTALKAFILKCPAKCKSVLDGKVKEETATMKMGTALHAAVLEPKSFDSIYRIGPEVRKNSNVWKDFAAQCEADGVAPMKPSENEDIIGMRDSLWSESGVSKILNACESRELSVFWNDEETGLYCKARLDIYGEKFGALLDLKGTGDARKDRFKRTAHGFGYHIQIPWYARGARAVGLKVNMSGILAVEFDAPYLPCIFEITGDLFKDGTKEINKALPALAACKESGKWPGLMPQGKPVQLRAPYSASIEEDFSE